MKKGFFGILVIGWLVLAGLGWAGVVEEVNAFRAAPLERLDLLEAPEEAAARWPAALWAGLAEGAPPLEEDPVLEEVAAERAASLLEAGLPLPEDFESGLREALRARGWPALMAREVYALLAFETPPAEEEVEGLLLERLFQAALENRPGAAALLFPCWGRAGAALRFGDLDIEGRTYHAAVLVVVLGAPWEEAPGEGRLLGYLYRGEEEGFAPLAGGRLRLETLGGRTVAEAYAWADGTYCLEGFAPGWYLLRLEGSKAIPQTLYFQAPDFTLRQDFYLFPVPSAP